MSQTLNTPTRRIPHPFAADYSPPRPRTRPSFPFADVSNTTHSRTTSPPPPPSSAVPPVPSVTSLSITAKRAKAPRRSTPTRQSVAHTSTLRVLISAPIPLSSPPPPVYQPVIEPSSAPQTNSDLLRPDSRIQRNRKKAKKLSPWDLKHVRASSPASKGLWTLFEVDEDWERITEELHRRPTSYAYLAPFIMTSPSTPCRYTPSPDKRDLSAKPSSEVLAPSPPNAASPQGFRDEERTDAVEVLTDTESSGNHVVTPLMEDEDPFALDGSWNDSPVRTFTFGASPTGPSRNSWIRRPAPLTLASSNKSRPSSYSSILFPDDEDVSPPISPSPAGPSKRSPKLLSPIAIASPGVREARRRSASGPPDATLPRAKRASLSRPDSPPTPLDLESALADFLACCGEHFSDLDVSAFSDSDSDGMADADLFYRRPRSSLASSDDEARSREPSYSASAFPLPPARKATSSRTQGLGLAIDMGSPTLFSPESAAPVTPPPMHRRRLLPSLPIIPTRSSSHENRQPTTRPMVKLPSEHSFLQAMSRGEELYSPSPWSESTSCPLSPASLASEISPAGSSRSAGSESSGGSAPKRGAIPAGWRLFAATNRI